MKEFTTNPYGKIYIPGIPDNVTGIYAIEFPEIMRAYVGQSVNVRNRINQWRSVLRSGKAKVKEFQSVWNIHSDNAKYKLIVDCDYKDLYKNETEVCRQYADGGWDLFNAVIYTQTNIMNVPEQYRDCIKRVIKALDYNRITPEELIRQLDNL